MKVPCPTCQQSIEWTPANVYRPFCSERCRLIDLGEWFSEERKIAGDDATAETAQIVPLFSAEDLALLDED